LNEINPWSRMTKSAYRNLNGVRLAVLSSLKSGPRISTLICIPFLSNISIPHHRLVIF
jgi:hypothetical protein